MSDVELAELYRQRSCQIYRRCLALLGDHDSAMDATHDIFLKLRDALASFEDRSKLSSWIYRVATNHCLNLLRRQRTGEKVRDSLTDGDTAPATQASNLERRQLVERLLARLDPRRVQIVLHIYYDGMSQSEVSELLSISERAVRKSLKSTLDTMRSDTILRQLSREEALG